MRCPIRTEDITLPCTQMENEKVLQSPCLSPNQETKTIRVVSYFLCSLHSLYWYEFLAKDGGSSGARADWISATAAARYSRCIAAYRRRNPFPSLPPRCPSEESWDAGHPQAGCNEIARPCGHADNQKFLHAESAILIILKDLRFLFSCLGCSQVISMTTGQQPSFLKAGINHLAVHLPISPP